LTLIIRLQPYRCRTLAHDIWQRTMRISVVIPVFNRQMLAVRALRSALAQDVGGLEVILVDDCSVPPFRLPDEFASDRQIRVVRHEANRGAGPARDSGVAASRADWIAFLDSDDYWLADTLKPRLETAERDFAAAHDLMIAYAAGFVLDRKSSGRREARIPRESRDLADFVSGCWFAPGSTALLRRDVYERVGPHDPMLRRLEDFDWYLRLALNGGRIEVWPDIAAIIETGEKPTVDTLERAFAHLRMKYADPASSCRLSPDLINRLEAFYDVARASIFVAERRWLSMAGCLCRSFWRVPRTSLQVRRFWKRKTSTSRSRLEADPVFRRQGRLD
jgi:glycosyltransferase involved in cell wall biosynthesis